MSEVFKPISLRWGHAAVIRPTVQKLAGGQSDCLGLPGRNRVSETCGFWCSDREIPAIKSWSPNSEANLAGSWAGLAQEASQEWVLPFPSQCNPLQFMEIEEIPEI